MKKALHQMTNEELWQLFPIEVVEHNPDWENWFTQQMKELMAILKDISIHSISHIGSTAIANIMAKPIIDILIEVNAEEDLKNSNIILEKHGYITMSYEEKRISMNKGYTIDGFAEKVFHIHLRIVNDNDEILFCDYLNNHPDLAKEYEQLKCSLAAIYRNNRDAYTDAKSEFIRKCMAQAKQEGY